MPVISFGKFLERLRGERDMSLRELGTLADVDHAYIHRLETGEKEAPSEEIIQRLVRVLKAGERKGKILKFLVSKPVDADLIELVVEDDHIPLDLFESAAQLSFRGKPSGKEGWRQVIKQLEHIALQNDNG